MSSSTGRPSAPTPLDGTDPGLEDVLESLYRDSGRRRRALPRFEPALHPPEDADDYAWLYRPEPLPDVDGDPTDPTVVRQLPPAAVPSRRRPRRGTLLLTGGLGGTALAVTALVVTALTHLLG